MSGRAIVIAYVFLATITLASCDFLSPSNDLKFLADYQKNPAGTITFTLTIRNEGSKTLELVSTSSQLYDIEIYQEPGILIWNWANDKSFLTVITTITLQPAQAQVYQATWEFRTNQGHPVPPGTYKVRARLVTEPSASYKFELTI
ncbi:MAG: BsuPI-related putative proteinase inhibitor [Candidatus Saccharicenans sp.]|uniref:BsuPI-related putative proteinase inhibitor n=1 Tax=Candidatus Saccharicenans sp. TaxID=2819258 RepID=UPI004048F667